MTTMLAAALAAFGADADGKLYELRVYHSPEGKLDALHARFRDHTMKLFAKHGMENVGYWTPIDNRENKLVYVLAHQDRAARDASFKAFVADPAWQQAFKASEADGPLVKVKAGKPMIAETFMTATDFSPKIAADQKGGRVFEIGRASCRERV